MIVNENYNIKHLNTFGLDITTKYFIEINHPSEIPELCKTKLFNKENYLILGEGSNILFTKDYSGTIIHFSNNNINIIDQNKDYVFIKAAAGLNWDSFVEFTIKNKFYGLENLSGIPGTIGASAVQNIGAYGREVSEFIHEIIYYDIDSCQFKSISKKDCNYDYRNSIFKNKLKNKAIITDVIYKLFKKTNTKLNYIDLKQYFDETKLEIKPENIRKAVIEIRNNKLPDPHTIGNAGSFFKNPIIDENKFNEINKEFSDIKYYKTTNNSFKIAAGWMIEKCGLKGYIHKNAAVHDKQALVLINKNGKATGKEILELSEIIKTKVFEKFRVQLETEVIIL